MILISRVLRLLVVAALLSSGCKRGGPSDKLTDAGVKQFEAHDYEAARLSFLGVLRAQPTNAVARLHLGKILFRQGQLGAAYPLLRSVRDVYASDLEVREQLAAIYNQAGKPEDARREAREVLKVQPSSERAILALAESTRNPADATAIRSELLALEKAKGPSSPVHVGLSLMALKGRDLREAESQAREAIRIQPNSSQAYLVLGTVQWSAGDTNAAESSFVQSSRLASRGDPGGLRLGQFLAQTGRRERARATLNALVKDQPELVAGWVLLADLALAEGDPAEAEKCIRRAASQAPTDLSARLVQARLAIYRKQPDDALRLLEEIAPDYPQAAELPYRLAQAFLAKGDIPKAILQLERSLSLDAGNEAAVLILAELNLSRGQASSAITSLSELVRRQKEIGPAHFLLARAYISAARIEDAIALYRGIARQQPENRGVAVQLAGLLRLRGQTAEARRVLQQVLKGAPADAAALGELVTLESSIGRAVDALSAVRLGIQTQPTNSLLLVLEGRIQAAQGQREEAQVVLKKALEMSPDLGPAYMALADLYFRSGNPRGAMDELDELRRREPANVQALVLSGVIASRLGMWERAQEAYEAAIQVRPNLVVALNNLAVILADFRKRPVDARLLAQKARALTPSEPVVADTVGWIEFRMGNYSTALPFLIEAFARLEGEPEVAAHLGLCHYMLGAGKEAERPLKVAVAGTNHFEIKALCAKRLESWNRVIGSDRRELDRGVGDLESDPEDVLLALKLADKFAQAGDSQRQRKVLETVYGVVKASPPILLGLAELTVDSDPERANQLVRDAQKLVPTEPIVPLILGRLALKSDDVAVAYPLLQSACRQLPARADGWLALSLASFLSSRLEEADAALRKVVELGVAEYTATAKAYRAALAVINGSDDVKLAGELEFLEKRSPNDPMSVLARATQATNRRQPGEAIRLLEEFLKRFPAHGMALRQAAFVEGLQLGNAAKAFDLAMRARQSLPKDGALARFAASQSIKKGDPRSALQILGPLVQSSPKDAGLLYDLGLAQHQAGELKAARASLEQALALDPQNPMAAEARKVLQSRPGG